MNQLPAFLANRQRRDLAAQAMGGISAGAGPHISIKDNRFTLIDGAGNQKPINTLSLDVCIIDANPSVSKIFYDPKQKYDPSGENNSAPICFSDNGQGASAAAAQPQNTSCQLCPWNAWGSAVSQMTGRQTKACNDGKKLAVLVPGQGVDGMVCLLRVPPATLKNLSKYTASLGGHNVDLPDVTTRLEFESQGVLKFTPTGYVDEATAAVTEKIWEAKGTEQLVGKQDRPWGGQADLQKATYAERAAIAPPAAQPAPAPAPAPAMAPPQPFGQAPGFGQQAGAPAQFGQSAPAPQFGGAPAPAGPFGAPPSPTLGPAPDPFAAFPGTQAPPAPVADAPKQRKPRAPKAAPAAEPDDGIPPFLRNQDNAAPPPAPEPSALSAPAGNQFGMQSNPPAPDAGMAAALDAAFRLPT